MKLFLLLDDFGYLAVIAGLIWWNVKLRTRMRGLHEPELWLPRRERRAHARKLLKREDEIYQEQMIARLGEALRGNEPHLSEREKGNE